MSRRRRMMEDLDQDIRNHIAIETQANIERGMSPDEARSSAAKFGNVIRVKEETWGVWSSLWIEQFLRDVCFAIRALRKTPWTIWLSSPWTNLITPLQLKNHPAVAGFRKDGPDHFVHERQQNSQPHARNYVCAAARVFSVRRPPE